MMALGIIGIIVGLALFMFLVYKGWSTYWVALIAAVIIAITNQIGVVEGILELFIPSLANQIAALFDFLFLGAILGRVFSDTGAATSLANALVKGFVGTKTGPKAVRAAVLAMTVLGAVLTIGGINAYIQLFATLPIALFIAEKVGIPRRFVPGLLCVNAPFIPAPGVPQLYNIFAISSMAEMGYEMNNWFGIIPGWIGVIVAAIACWFILSQVIIKAMDKGEGFEWGGVAKVDATNRKLPPVIFAIIPLAIVFVLYTLCGFELVIALTAAIVAALLLMFKYIPEPTPIPEGEKRKFRFPGSNNKIINTLNQGAIAFPGSLLQVAVPTGLAGVVTGTAVFGTIAAAIGGINVSPLWIALVVVMVIAALTSSPVVAISLAIPIAMGAALTAGVDVNPGHLARIVALGASTLETLPVNGAVLLALGLCKCNHKQGYGAIAIATVVATTIGVVVCALLCFAFPTLP